MITWALGRREGRTTSRRHQMSLQKRLCCGRPPKLPRNKYVISIFGSVPTESLVGSLNLPKQQARIKRTVSRYRLCESEMHELQ